MARIIINHSCLETAAKAIDDYLATHTGRMVQANARVEALKSYWKNEDYYAAKIKWEELSSQGSTSENMIKALKSYRDLLLYARKEYQKAQSAAVNRSRWLP